MLKNVNSLGKCCHCKDKWSSYKHQFHCQMTRNRCSFRWILYHKWQWLKWKILLTFFLGSIKESWLTGATNSVSLCTSSRFRSPFGWALFCSVTGTIFAGATNARFIWKSKRKKKNRTSMFHPKELKKNIFIFWVFRP